jgi:hypothetical protein
MINYKKILFAFFITLLAPLAQAVEQTGEVWNTNKISVALKEKHLGFSVEEEIRIRNTDGFYYSHADVGFSNNSLDLFGFSLNYRIVFENRDGWFIEHRPHLNVAFKHKHKKVSFSNRFRIELRLYEIKETQIRYRNKTKISVKINDFSIYISDEIFFIHSEQPVPRNRSSTGITYSPSKILKLYLSYRLQQDFKEVLILNHVGYFKIGVKI